MKSDKSIKNICIAAIIRHTMLPHHFLITTFFEKETWQEFNNDRFEFLNLAESELPVSTTFIDIDNFTLVTTRRIITCQNGITGSANVNNIVSWDYKDFKRPTNNHFTKGKLVLNDERVLDFFIETGRASSMVTIYAIKTLMGISK